MEEEEAGGGEKGKWGGEEEEEEWVGASWGQFWNISGCLIPIPLCLKLTHGSHALLGGP